MKPWRSRRLRFSREEKAQIYLVLAVSLLLIYMVTAAVFESIPAGRGISFSAGTTAYSA